MLFFARSLHGLNVWYGHKNVVANKLKNPQYEIIEDNFTYLEWLRKSKNVADRADIYRDSYFLAQ